MTKPELKIIADHLRSSCFLIADGILPSNEGRGYVLRRIMRRGMRQLHKLGSRTATMYKLVDALINEMGSAYPELSRARATIIETLKNEEEKFRETLDKGLKILEDSINYPPLEGGSKSASDSGRGKFSGAVAFKLYDTYGFPLDLTQDILKEKNIAVDVEEFDSEMEKQRNRGKENWSGSGEAKEDNLFFELKEKFGATKFLGYETLEAKAKILAVLENGIILDQTPFYGTSGGQKGDDGRLLSLSKHVMSSESKHPSTGSGNGELKISETKKLAGNLFVHFFSEAQNQFKVGDEVIAQVNPKTRQMRAVNHSATHLMHKALKEILGNSISQKGSNVDADYFTFDFNFNRAATEEEKTKIENFVNDAIQKNSPVKTELMPLEKARETGAEALFGEKYDAEVRVISMSPSVELCGGTHVKQTGDIGVFKILSEKGIAAGIRRIEAIAGNDAVKKFNDEKAKEAQDFLNKLRADLIKKDEEISRLDKNYKKTELTSSLSAEDLQQEIKKRDKEIERLKKQVLLDDVKNLKAEKLGEINILHHVFVDVEAKELREITSEIKARADFTNSHIFAFFGIKEEKVAVCIAVSNDLQNKFDAAKLIPPVIEKLGGKGGGGKKDFAMGGGSNKDAISQAIEVLKSQIN
jgi:alanyl-tRNA synthetase